MQHATLELFCGMLSTCLYVPTREAGRQRPVLLACIVELWGRRACREVVVDGFAGPSVSSWGQEFHGHQGAMLNPCLYILVDIAFLMNGRDDRPSSGLIQDRRRLSGGHPFNAGHRAPSMTCREGLTALPWPGQLVDL